jgi:hypothetical protein
MGFYGGSWQDQVELMPYDQIILQLDRFRAARRSGRWLAGQPGEA